MDEKLPFITKGQIRAMERLGVSRKHIDELLKHHSLADVAKYIRGSVKSGDDGDDAAGPRVEDQ